MNNWINKYGSKILSALGIIGVGATAVLAVKATPAAMQHIAEAEAEEPIDKVRACWRDYIPAVATGLGTMICIGSAQFLNDRQIKNLTGGLAALEGMFAQYREHNKNINGEYADEFIMKRIHEEDMDDIPPWDDTCHFVISFYDETIDLNETIEFEDTMQNVEHAEWKADRLLQDKGIVTINDLLKLFHLKPIGHGDERGWSQHLGEALYGYDHLDFFNPAVQYGDLPYLVRDIQMPVQPHSFNEDECQKDISRKLQSVL